MVGWTFPGRRRQGKRIRKGLDWGAQNGLNPNDPKWAAAVGVAALGSLTFVDVLEAIGAGLVIVF